MVRLFHILPFGTNNYPPFQHSTQKQLFIPALGFLFLAKLRLEITQMAQRWCRGFFGANGWQQGYEHSVLDGPP